MMSLPVSSTLDASNSSSLSPSSSSSSFPIFVKVPSGSSLVLQIDRSDTLASLFAQVEDRLEWTMIPAFARLQTLDGRTLVSMGSLWQQGVAYDSTLELLFPVLGGAPTRQDDSESDQDDDLPRLPPPSKRPRSNASLSAGSSSSRGREDANRRSSHLPPPPPPRTQPRSRPNAHRPRSQSTTSAPGLTTDDDSMSSASFDPPTPSLDYRPLPPLPSTSKPRVSSPLATFSRLPPQFEDSTTEAEVTRSSRPPSFVSGLGYGQHQEREWARAAEEGALVDGDGDDVLEEGSSRGRSRGFERGGESINADSMDLDSSDDQLDNHDPRSVPSLALRDDASDEYESSDDSFNEDPSSSDEVYDASLLVDVDQPENFDHWKRGHQPNDPSAQGRRQVRKDHHTSGEHEQDRIRRQQEALEALEPLVAERVELVVAGKDDVKMLLGDHPLEFIGEIEGITEERYFKLLPILFELINRRLLRNHLKPIEETDSTYQRFSHFSPAAVETVHLLFLLSVDPLAKVGGHPALVEDTIGSDRLPLNWIGHYLRESVIRAGDLRAVISKLRISKPAGEVYYGAMLEGLLDFEDEDEVGEHYFGVHFASTPAERLASDSKIADDGGAQGGVINRLTQDHHFKTFSIPFLSFKVEKTSSTLHGSELSFQQLQRLNSQDGRTEQLLIQTLGTVSWNAALGASTAVFVQFPRPLLELTEKVSRDYVLPEVPQPSNLEELVEKACQHVDSSVLISKQLKYETIDRRAIQAAKLFASSFVPLSAQDAFGGIRYLRLGKDITLMDGNFDGTYFGPIQGRSPEFDCFLADLVAGQAGMPPFDFTLQDFDRSIFAARYGTFIDLWAVVFVHIGYGIYIILLIRYLFITRPRLILGQSAILFSGFKNGRLCLPNIPIVHRFFNSPSLETAEPVLEYMDARLRDEFSGRAEKRFISFVGTPMVFEVATGLWIVYVPSMHLGHEKYTPVVQHLLHQLLLLTADVNQIAISLSGTLPPNGAYGSREDAEALKAAIVKEMEKTGLDVPLQETRDELRRYLSSYSALQSLNAYDRNEASFEAHSTFSQEIKAKTLANEIVAQGKPNSTAREEQWAAMRDNKIGSFCPPGTIPLSDEHKTWFFRRKEGIALQVAANASEVNAGKLDRMAAARASREAPFDARRRHPSYSITESLLETILHLLDPSSHHKESTGCTYGRRTVLCSRCGLFGIVRSGKDRHTCPGKDERKVLAGRKNGGTDFELSHVLFPIQLLLHPHFGPEVETLLQEDESPFATLPETFTNPTTKASVPIFVSTTLFSHPLYQPYHQALLEAAQALEKLEPDPSTEDITSAVGGIWETYYKLKEVVDWVQENGKGGTRWKGKGKGKGAGGDDATVGGSLVASKGKKKGNVSFEVHGNADSEHAGLASEVEEEDSVASTSTSTKLSIPRRVVSAKGKEREDLGTLTVSR